VRRLLVVGAATMLLGGCASMTAETEPLSAEAALKDKDGKDVGRATLIETGEGVRIAVTGYRLPPGAHGLHIHAVGRCEPPQFTSAGAHFNPAGKQHGTQNSAGPHNGDLPNLEVAALRRRRHRRDDQAGDAGPGTDLAPWTRRHLTRRPRGGRRLQDRSLGQ
jgi:Cu-Zn family superoxide dismutase